MRWTPGGSSDNVEDRRGMGSGMKMGGGAGIGAVLVVLFLSWITGKDMTSILGLLSDGGSGAEPGAVSTGVPPNKISLGLASYSDHWYPSWDSTAGPRMRGGDITYERAISILAQHNAIAHGHGHILLVDDRLG